MGDVVLTALSVAGSHSVVACGTACPTPSVTACLCCRPAPSYVVMVERVTPLALSAICVLLPHQSYSVVVVGSWAGLLPPSVIAAAGLQN
ncbi:hypothetical protein [Streptomyces violascens]|uniref:hypothetical protein n=1 Tax=Streptomyces violascens TaxID=67381 RepID=UPI0036549AB7